MERETKEKIENIIDLVKKLRVATSELNECKISSLISLYDTRICVSNGIEQLAAELDKEVHPIDELETESWIYYGFKFNGYIFYKAYEKGEEQ